MRARVTAGSRHNHLALYDPESLPEGLDLDPDLDAQEPKPISVSSAKDLAARGLALILHIPGEDCEATIGLFVDEDPPASILDRGALVLSGARLSAPSGALSADGLEFMTRPGEPRTHSEPEGVAVPAGDYEVEVRNLLSWKLKNRTAVVRSGRSAGERWAHRLLMTYTWIGIVLIPANVLVAPALVAFLWQRSGLRSALWAAAIILAIDVVVFGGFWILDPAGKKRFPALSRISEAETAFDLENPDIAVILRRRSGSFTAKKPAFAKIRVRGARGA
jgi:hypothetical protein